MASDLSSAGASAPRTQQRFTLYAHDGRLVARNVDDKLIDLGSLRREADDTWRWHLDGNGLSGSSNGTAGTALRDIGKRMGFLYLDGQFTAVADLREGTPPDLSRAEQAEVVLDELQPGERMEDARV